VTAAHAVLPSDEGRHTPDPDDLWNESYYFDFVTPDRSVGGWLRLGLYPNRQVAWWTAWIVRPGHPGVSAVDYHAPVPPGDGLVSASAATGDRVELELLDPLASFRVTADTTATLIPDPADAYLDTGALTATRLRVDLTWTTDGVPYHYELTTRYEIPCTVAGTVTLGDATIRIDGQGQRDHSWGVRDWWAFGWCWCSLRLDDGTRIHLSDIRIPGMPVFFGYIQTPHEPTTPAARPVTALSVHETLGEHGFPASARIEVAAAPARDLGLDVTPLAFGPVLLRDDESGKTSRFPRAMIACTADDGRTGTGWIEWNQPDPEPVV
jgi:hypothetical protein